MPKRAKRKGFEELSPNKTAWELFQHLQEGDKVAITSRRITSDTMEYATALQQRGFTVRVLSNQSDVADFCFLLKAQKELVGMSRSTYILWAAILGNATKSRLYSIDSPNTRIALGLGDGGKSLVEFNWTHPNLHSRLFFEVYQSEEMEEEQRFPLKNVTITNR